MPRASITLADVREEAVVILCEPCARGRYNVGRLSIYDRCRARYERYYGW